MSWLDSILPIRRILVSGRAKPYMPDLEFGSGLTVTTDEANGKTVVVADAGSAGTVTPDPDELVLRDGSGRAFATEFVGPAAADVVVEAQSGQSCSFNAPTANYKFSDSTTSAYPVTLVCDGTQSFITCSSTSGFRYRAGEHTFSNTTASAITGSLTVELRSGEMRIEGKGASKPVELHAPSGQPLRLASIGGSRMRLGTSGIIAIDRWDGAVWEEEGSLVARSDGLSIEGVDPSTYVKLTNSNAVEIGSDTTVSTSVSAGTLTLTESNSSGTYLLAANAPMRVQPEQATSGAGRALTIGGGAGQTPGTHLAGDVVVDLGQRVSNNTAALSIHDSSGEFLRLRGSTFANHSSIEHTRTNSSLRFEANSSGAAMAFSSTGFLQLWATAANGYMDVLASYYQWRDASGTTRKTERLGSAAISTATTTNVVTFATTSNRVYQCVGRLTVSNDTDNEGAAYMVRAAFKNVAGTVTQIGSTQAIAADLEDAGQTGLAAVLDFSGTDIRLRLTTDAADTVNVNGWLDVHERVLA